MDECMIVTKMCMTSLQNKIAVSICEALLVRIPVIWAARLKGSKGQMNNTKVFTIVLCITSSVTSTVVMKTK